MDRPATGSRSQDFHKRETANTGFLGVVAPAAPAGGAGRVVSREELYRQAWGATLRDGDRSCDVYVHKLRAKLERALPGQHFIHTHVGFGYRLDTGDGFEKFCRGELQIADASRGIEKDEYDACKAKNITPVEVQVGIDGLSVVAHEDLAIPNDCITTTDLKKLLDPKSKITNYKQLGSGFPDQKVSFFTPGTESGTYDYFTEAVLETEAEQRTKDVQTSADDNQIVTGIEGTPGSLGYVGFAFADSQKDKLKILAVDGGDGCVKPEIATIADGSYKPLSRPLFMYPNTESVKKPEVKAFVQYVLDNNEKVVTAADYVPLTDELLRKSRENLASATPVEAPAT